MSRIVQPCCIFTPNVIMCGGGGAYERDTWDCPECGKNNARRITEWPNYYMYLPGYFLCECGDRWTEESRAPRPFRRGWRAEAQQHFEALWEQQCAPDGSTFTYDDEGYLVVVTPDGTRHTAWTAIGADDQPTLIEET